MSFNSVAFLIFLPVTVLVHYLLPHKVRWVWLLLASYVFYMSWRPEMALLIFSVTTVSYAGGLAAWYFRGKGKNKAAGISAGAAGTVCVLALVFFKYFSFIAETVSRIASIGGEAFSWYDIVLPVGISFYTFQAVGYVVDVARGKIEAETHFGYYALFVSFFPQLVAGPIEKAEVLIPQLKAKKTLEGANIRSGLFRMLTGFFKKIAVADMMAGPVNAIFADVDKAGSGLAALGAVMFAIQIFCDFSGYTDIAIGAAELLGIRLSKNFDKPYAAVSVNDFWRRWHISLSGWFRDYVYIPLGGNRKGEFRTCINLIIVFLLSGLWHGAAWHFVLWGLLHGVLIVADRLTKKPRDAFWKAVRVDPEGKAITTFRRIATFITVCFLWIFFRAESISEAWKVITTIFSFKAGSVEGVFGDLTTALILLAGTALLIVVDSGRVRLSLPFSGGQDRNGKLLTEKETDLPGASPAVIVVMIWAVVWAWLLLSSTSAESAFIYFQF